MKWNVRREHVDFNTDCVNIYTEDKDLNILNVKYVIEDSHNNFDFYKMYIDTNKGLETIEVKINNRYDVESYKILDQTENDGKILSVRFMRS